MLFQPQPKAQIVRVNRIEALMGASFLGVISFYMSAALFFYVLGSQTIKLHLIKMTAWLIYQSLGIFYDSGRQYGEVLKNDNINTAWIFSLILSVIVFYITYSVLAVKRDPFVHVSGRRLLKGKEAAEAAHKKSEDNIKAAKTSAARGLKIHPYLTLTRQQEAQSTIVLGSQGGGKTQVIWRILDAAIKRNDKMVVYDLVKGDFTKSIYNSPNGAEPIILSPWDERSLAWDLGNDITTQQDAQSFSRGLIDESKEPIWSNSARMILTAILIKLIRENGTDWGWDDLVNLLYSPIEDFADIAKEYYPPAFAAVADPESKTTQSIIINLHSFTSPIFSIAKFWRDIPKNKRFSLINWLSDDDSHARTIILQGNSGDKTTSAPFIRAVTEILTNKTASLSFGETNQNSGRRIWFFMDEIKQAGKIECISTLTETCRSKGVACVFGLQDVSQIRQIYDENEAQKWLALTGLKIYARVSGGDTQEWVLRQVGKRTVERYNKSVSTSQGGTSVNESYSAAEIDVMTAVDLERLGPDGSGVNVLIIGHGDDALQMHFKYFSPPDLRPSFIERSSVSTPKSSGLVSTGQFEIMSELTGEHSTQPVEEESMTELKENSIPEIAHTAETIFELLDAYTEKNEAVNEVPEPLILSSSSNKKRSRYAQSEA